MANLADTIVLGDLTVTREQLIKGTLTVDGLISGNGGGLTNLNASNLSSGTVSTARLPAAALVGDTTYSAGTGLTLSGTTFNISNPFNPNGAYSGLRAQATTAVDVGLGSVRNVPSYSQAESEARYLRNSSDTLAGNLVIDNGATTSLKVVCDDAGEASVEAYGGSQGTGIMYVGQSITHGGGVSYNGDGTPAFATGEGSDEIVFYRREAGANHAVFGFMYNSNNVNFRGNVIANDITITSDIRVKSDIQPVTGALQKVLSLTGFTYHMKGLAKTDRRLGLSAQDVLKVFPEAVHGTEETHYSVSYGSLVAGVVEAIKEQQSIIVDQQETIDELKDRLTALEDSRRS